MILSDNCTAITIISTYAQPIATMLGALIVVVFAPLIGAWAYFRRKEYETVRQRYLDDGILPIIKQVEDSLNIFEYNWAHSIHLLKIYRDLSYNTPPELYKSGFVAINKPVSFEASRHYLLMDIIGDKVYFNVHQLLTAFLHDSNSLFIDDLCSAIRVSLEGGKEDTEIAAPEVIFNTYVKELEKKSEEHKPYYIFLGNLQILASLLAKEQYSFKKLGEFRNKPEVQKSISVLKEMYKEQLAKYSDLPVGKSS